MELLACGGSGGRILLNSIVDAMAHRSCFRPPIIDATLIREDCHGRGKALP